MPPFRINRRMFGALASLAAASVALPALHAQGRPERHKISIAVGGKAALNYLPLVVADQLGYFKAEGLDVELHDFADGTQAMQAVASNATDVCCGAFERTLLLQGKGQLFRAIVLLGRAPQIALGVSTRGVPEYKTIEDLKGRKWGVSSLDSSTHLVASTVLARAALTAADVSFVRVGAGASAVVALRGAQIDALSSTDPAMTMLEQRGEVKIIVDTRTLKGTQQLFGGPMPAACLFAANEFVQKNPNTTQALSHAIVHALKWLQTAGPGDIIKTVPEDAYLLGDRALFLASFDKVREAISPDGLVPDEGPVTAMRALARVDAIAKPERIDLSKTYTNEFARKSKDRFKA